MWNFGCSCTPDDDVSRVLRNAVWFDIPKEDEFVAGRDMFDEEARAFVNPRIVLSVTDGRVANRDIWEDGLVFPIVAEAKCSGMRKSTRL